MFERYGLYMTHYYHYLLAIIDNTYYKIYFHLITQCFRTLMVKSVQKWVCDRWAIGKNMPPLLSVPLILTRRHTYVYTHSQTETRHFVVSINVIKLTVAFFH